jgi:hypothetical protein
VVMKSTIFWDVETEQIELSVNAFDLFSGGAQFKSRPGH